MDLNKGNDALSQPVRARLFDLLSELKRPASTDELAGLTDRHPNGIRQHLETLSDAGLLVREQQRIGRGRPRDLWSIDPTASPGGSKPTAYAELGTWLARAIASGPVEPGEIEVKGHEIGLELVRAEGEEALPEARFHDALAAMGFQPARLPDRDGSATYCLNNCPYRDVVRERQPLICALHRGITTGLLKSIDESAELTGFEARDPDEAGCTIRISEGQAGPAA